MLRALALLPPLLALAASVRAAPEVIAPKPPRPSTIREVEAMLDVKERIEALVATARRHPAWRVIDAYEAYGPDDWDRRDRYRAEDLLELMATPEKKWGPEVPIDVRQAAQRLLLSDKLRASDPDLVERRRKRFQKKVADYLDHPNEVTRQFAYDYLHQSYKEQWDGLAREIRDYRVDGDRGNWIKAVREWGRFLK